MDMEGGDGRDPTLENTGELLPLQSLVVSDDDLEGGRPKNKNHLRRRRAMALDLRTPRTR
jgi:hypothetical protein